MKRIRNTRRNFLGENESSSQLNLLIPASKHRALKQYAAAKGESMSALVCEWIDKHVENGYDKK